MNFYNHFKRRKIQIIKIYDNSDQSHYFKIEANLWDKL